MELGVFRKRLCWKDRGIIKEVNVGWLGCILYSLRKVGCDQVREG